MGVDLAAGGEPGCPRQVPIVRAGPADIETLGLVSTLGYIDAVRRASRSGFRFSVGHGLGTPDNPIFPSMHGGRSADRRGSVAGARAIADGEVDRAVNFYPSLRHAMANHAPGFCFHNENEAAQTHRRGAAGRGAQGRPRRRRREPRRADRVLRDPGRGACASTRARCHCSIRTRGLQPHRRSVRCPSTRKTVHYWWSLNIHFFPRAMQTGVADGRNRNSDSWLPFRPGRPGVEWVSRTPNLRRPATATHQHMPSCQPVARGGLPGTAQPAETTQPTGRCLRRTPPVPGDQPGMIVDERARAVGPSRPHDLVGRQSGQK